MMNSSPLTVYTVNCELFASFIGYVNGMSNLTQAWE